MLITINKNKAYTYVGYTSNLKKRILLHNSSKGAKFTKGRKWILIYKRKYFDKSDALKNEYKLKKNSILRKKLKDKYIKKHLT